MDIECLYQTLTVGMDAPPEALQRIAGRHGGQEPRISVGVGRKRF